MRGRLYGIGIGPGDPELMTLKAIKTIQHCAVIAKPSAGAGEGTAFQIAEEYLKDKPLLECRFSMDKDEEKRKAARAKAADDICAVLDQGKDVGFITLGDPTVYSTYMYIHKVVAERGYDTRIIPGVPSFAAVAAALNTSLCEGTEPLLIIPASDREDIDELLAFPGNKVIMKSGKSINSVMSALNAKKADVKLVERCTMEGERVFGSLAEFLEDGTAGYFTTAIVKER